MHNLQEITSENFKSVVLESTKPYVVEFGAPWCKPCQSMLPMLEAFVKNHPEFGVGKVDVDDSPELAKQYGVRGVPAFLVFKDGSVVNSHVGTLTEKKLLELLK